MYNIRASLQKYKIKKIHQKSPDRETVFNYHLNSGLTFNNHGFDTGKYDDPSVVAILTATTEQLFRLIQSIPSPKAEPFKLWMAQVAKERLDEMQDPELTIDRAMREYKALGYSDNWINQRLKSIEIRKDLTDEWKRHGLQEGVQFATLTDIIYQTWAGKTAKEKNPQHLEEHEVIAKQGGKAAEAARKQLESDLGHSVISPLNARTGLRLKDKNDKE